MLWRIEDSHLMAAQQATIACRKTPLVRAPQLGDRVWLKLETEQLTGSFKLRGALTRLGVLSEAERNLGVVAASAGNHGLGVAWAARLFGIPALVVVPETSAHVKREGIAALGAEIQVAEGGYDEADAQARALASESGRTFVSPYDDPFVAAGNGGSLAAEILDALPTVGSIVLPIGGGGLASGVAAMRAQRRRDFRIVAVQSEACPAMHESLRRGHALERFEGAPTLAEGLEGGVAQGAFENVRRDVGHVALVSEEDIARAIAFAYHELGRVIEGSAAVALAWVLSARDRDDAEFRGTDAVIVLTGRNVDEPVLREALASQR